MIRPLAILSCALCLGAPALAQSELAQRMAGVDCTNPTSQVEMTGCAALAFERADEDLNLAYGMARDAMRARDADLPADAVPGEIILRDAQRAWIPFRDQACEAESLLMRGGTGQSMLFHSCLERLTRQRTEDLRLIGELN
jgi:uncharacterized protein YecT (DUF1311 family)